MTVLAGVIIVVVVGWFIAGEDPAVRKAHEEDELRRMIECGTVSEMEKRK